MCNNSRHHNRFGVGARSRWGLQEADLFDPKHIQSHRPTIDDTRPQTALLIHLLQFRTRCASNHAVISCFFNQVWVFFWVTFVRRVPTNACGMKQLVVAMFGAKHYIARCFRGMLVTPVNPSSSSVSTTPTLQVVHEYLDTQSSQGAVDASLQHLFAQKPQFTY